MPRKSQQLKRRKGSILIAVLGLIALLSALMISFMAEAVERIRYNGLLDKGSDLRERAYSGLEVSLAAISQLGEIDDGLRSCSQGWGTPLQNIGFTPFDDCELSVVCEDESGKLPLANMNEDELATLFEELGIGGSDADKLATALLDWMDPNDNPRINGTDGEDYERAGIPCIPTNAVPRSWEEFYLIDGFRLYFQNDDGSPTELFKQFKQAVSLQNSSTVNINDASAFVIRVLAEIGDFDEDQILRLLEGDDRVRGNDDDKILEAADELSARNDIRLAAFKAQLLRVRVVASRGDARFTLDAFLQYKGASSSGTAHGLTKSRLNNAYKDFPDNPASSLSYPFTILQITENRSID